MSVKKPIIQFSQDTQPSKDREGGYFRKTITPDFDATSCNSSKAYKGKVKIYYYLG